MRSMSLDKIIAARKAGKILDRRKIQIPSAPGEPAGFRNEDLNKLVDAIWALAEREYPAPIVTVEPARTGVTVEPAKIDFPKQNDWTEIEVDVTEREDGKIKKLKARKIR